MFLLVCVPQAKIRSHSGAYFEAVEADRIAVEASLNESSRRMDAEREAEGGTEDHDDRKLKKSERLRLVIKNKVSRCCVFLLCVLRTAQL